MNIFDQEEVASPEEIAMLIWDPDLLIPSNDLFEVQEPLTTVLAMKTRSSSQHVSNDLTTTPNLGGKPTPDHSKEPFSPRRNPIKIHTREFPNLDYNIVEYLKNFKANISVIDMCRIPRKKYFLLQALKSVENPTTSTDQGRNITPTDLGNKPTVNTFFEDNKRKTCVPPFLLTFYVFKKNLHNCLV
jgi:hypothetical protein